MLQQADLNLWIIRTYRSDLAFEKKKVCICRLESAMNEEEI